MTQALISLQCGNRGVCHFLSVFSPSESGQREQRQPVAGCYCQESGDRRKGGGEWSARRLKPSVQETALESRTMHTVVAYAVCNRPTVSAIIRDSHNTINYLPTDLRSLIWAQATCESTLGDSRSHRTLLCPKRGPDRARWPGWRGVEILRGSTAGTRTVWLLSARPFCQLHPRQQLYSVWSSGDIQLER